MRRRPWNPEDENEEAEETADGTFDGSTHGQLSLYSGEGRSELDILRSIPVDLLCQSPGFSQIPEDAHAFRRAANGLVVSRRLG